MQSDIFVKNFFLFFLFFVDIRESDIEDDATIHKILSHLKLLYTPNRSPPPIITALWEKEESGYPSTTLRTSFADFIPDFDACCRDI